MRGSDAVMAMLQEIRLEIARDGALGVRHIDAFVERVATVPLRPDEMNDAIGKITRDASFVYSTIRTIIRARYAAGRYEAVIDADATGVIAKNLARIIALPAYK